MGCGDETLPFRFLPACHWTPLIVSVPHAGLEWPSRLQPRPPVSLARNADYGVDQLFAAAPEFGAAMVVARNSRLVVDLNRAEDDISALICPEHPNPRPRARPGSQEKPTLDAGRDGGGVVGPKGHRGVIWGMAVGEIRVLSRPLSHTEFEDRLRRYHRPYRRALAELTSRRRQRFGYAVLLDAHSMPGSVGHDFVLGTAHGRACAPEIARTAERALRSVSPSCSVAIDTPYPGGALVAEFGRPSQGVHALQIEVNRALYMDERRLSLRPDLTGAARSGARADGPAARREAAHDPGQEAGTLARLHALLVALAVTQVDPSKLAGT